MNQQLDDLTSYDKKELALIFGFLNRLENLTNAELPKEALNEMDKKQPALQNMALFFNKTGKFSEKQMMTITRLLILIWWVYKEKLPPDHPKIDDALFSQIKEDHQAWIKEITSLGAEKERKAFAYFLETYPPRWLYGQVQGKLFVEKDSPLYTLSNDDKHFLLTNIHILIDCFEIVVLLSRRVKE